MLDTSFLIRLVSPAADYHDVAEQYYREFVKRGIPMYVSSIALGEFFTRHTSDELPDGIRNLAFNPFDALKTGIFAKILVAEQRAGVRKAGERDIIKNDVMLFAQTENLNARFFMTTDKDSAKYISTISKQEGIHFEICDISKTSVEEHFGLLLSPPE